MTSLPIYLSSGSLVIVKVGDVVKAGDVLAKREVVKNVEIDLSAALRVSPKKVKKFLKKNPGDSVSEGDVIASRSKLLGMQEEKILSHVKGTVAKYDRNKGTVGIILHDGNMEDSEEEVRSPIDGVVELCDNDSSKPDTKSKILIKTDKNVLAGNLGVGGSVEGIVHLLTDEGNKPEEVVVQLHHMDTSIIGKILLGGIMDRDVLVKAIGMGVKGIIGANIPDLDIEYIKERGLGVPVINVEVGDFSKLVKWNAKKVFMNGSGKTILFLQK